jgi:molecular chaperone GrpE
MNEALDSIDISIEEELELDGVPTLDDFMRELEEREKMLEISVSNPKDNLKHDVSKSAPKEQKPSKPHKQTDDLIEKFQTKIATLEKEREEFLSTMRRRQIDFESFKNRTERERSETFQNLVSKIASQILPVVDNLDRALDSSGFTKSDIDEKKSVEFMNFLEGITLVSQQLFNVLTEMGLESIPTVGKPFDPHFHEAVATEPSEEFESNTVIGELLRGYKIGNKVIRASMVKVSS